MIDMEDKDPKDTFEEKKPEEILVDNNAEDVVTEEEKAEALTQAEEIETEWARTLHIDYDAEEARQRAEAVQQSSAPVTPPPMPGVTPPPAPTPNPEPFHGYNNQPANNGTPAQPGQPNMQYGHAEPMPKTYLVWAVLSMVLCCFIPGLIAVIFSTSVSSKYYARDYEGARRASEVTQYWIIASIVLGVVSMTLYLPIMMLVN